MTSAKRFSVIGHAATNSEPPRPALIEIRNPGIGGMLLDLEQAEQMADGLRQMIEQIRKVEPGIDTIGPRCQRCRLPLSSNIGPPLCDQCCRDGGLFAVVQARQKANQQAQEAADAMTPPGGNNGHSNETEPGPADRADAAADETETPRI